MYEHSTVSKPQEIAGREVTSIANLLEGESSLVKKLEMLISMEMTAIVVNGHSKGFKIYSFLTWHYFRALVNLLLNFISKLLRKLNFKLI